MKKLLSIILLAITLCCTLVSCSDDEPVIYSINRGIKIEELSISRQQTIDEYVTDCKMLYMGEYAQNLSEWSVEEPYITFTDTFIYDFRNIDENNLDDETSRLWNAVKALNGGVSEPIMYIELFGFSNHWCGDYKVTTFQENAITHGYFIFENETVIVFPYKRICDRNYFYVLPQGTGVINCGNKYFEEKTMEELLEFNSALNKGLTIDDRLKTLKLVK